LKTPFFQFNPKNLPKKQRAKLWYVFKALKSIRFLTYTLNTKGEILLVTQTRGYHFRRLTIGKRGGISMNGRYMKCAEWLSI
jgi:hypothetical protein